MKSVTRSCFMIMLVSFAASATAQSECSPLFIFSGEIAFDQFGNSVASAGDVNNDGYGDLIVGAWENDASGNFAGRAYVFSGLNGDTLYVFTGEAAMDKFGTSLASAGDVNNDGYADLFVGATGNDAGGSNAGRAYVFSGLDGDTLYVFNGESAANYFGGSVASAGDVNNDGYDDLIVGAAGYGSVAGRAYVFSGLNGDTLHVFTGEAASNRLGRSVASAGDVNNDGYSDLIVGAWSNDAGGSDAGRAYVFSGLNGDTLHIFTGAMAGDALGVSVASAGDVNNDGYSDLIVGAAGYENLTGRAYVFSGLNGDTLYVFTGESGDLLGLSVASTGHVNNDDYADLIVDAKRNDAGGADAGRVYVFSGLNGDTLFVYTGEAAGDNFGHSTASAGDVNNDGYDDLIVGAIGNDVKGPAAGRAYVLLSSGCGDVNDDGLVSPDDLTFLIDFYFSFGEAPCGFGSDVNTDGSIDIADIVYLAQYLNNNGPAPCATSEPPPSLFDPKKEPEGRQTGPTGY